MKIILRLQDVGRTTRNAAYSVGSRTVSITDYGWQWTGDCKFQEAGRIKVNGRLDPFRGIYVEIIE